MTGGRGSGKSFASSLYCAKTLVKPDYRILYTRYTLTSAHISIIPEFMQKIHLIGHTPIFSATLNSVKNNRNGSEILFKGIKSGSGTQTANLKSLNGVNCWVLDEAEELDDEKTFNTIDLSIRDTRHRNLIILAMNPSYKSHWIYQRFFKNIPNEFNGVENNITYIHTSYLDNLRNLSEDYIQLAKNLKETNLLEYNRIWMGHWAEQVEGALWKYNVIEDNRLDNSNKLPDFDRVILAIDPAVTSKENSDSTGIVTVARGTDGHYYVLSDLTCKTTPLDWANIAIKEYYNRKCDRIVAEVNQGGDLVENTLRNVNKSISYRSVHATRGKILRAEPIAALYEQKLVHHVGREFNNLETEMITFTGKSNDRSPNRLDALVFAITELSEGIGGFEIATLPNKKTWNDIY